jgi:hypothetical protein
METYIQIHDAEIIDGKIVVNKVVIVDEMGNIIREATMNANLLGLLKRMMTNTKFQKVIKMFEQDKPTLNDIFKSS